LLYIETSSPSLLLLLSSLLLFVRRERHAHHIHTAVARKGGVEGGREGRKDEEKEKAFADEPLWWQ